MERKIIINEDKIGENITSNNNSYTFLFDTGVSKNGVVHNADIFGIDFNQHSMNEWYLDILKTTLGTHRSTYPYNISKKR